jgi:hypothetical protein
MAPHDVFRFLLSSAKYIFQVMLKIAIEVSEVVNKQYAFYWNQILPDWPLEAKFRGQNLEVRA